eukprot:819070-Rhodomonas_salina.1
MSCADLACMAACCQEERRARGSRRLSCLSPGRSTSRSPRCSSRSHSPNKARCDAHSPTHTAANRRALTPLPASLFLRALLLLAAPHSVRAGRGVPRAAGQLGMDPEDDPRCGREGGGRGEDQGAQRLRVHRRLLYRSRCR